MSLSSSIPRKALIVGGTSGIGRGIAQALAKRDVDVTIAGRSSERGNEVVEQLSKLSPNNTHQFVPVDGFDLSSVKKLADDTRQCDLLVMTQGIATIQGYTQTVDGIDQKLQLHYFSRFYLAKLLAPHMKEGSRILTVLSAGVHSKYKNVEEDFDLKQAYSLTKAADAAGYYNDAGFEAISDEYPELVVAHACPGFVNTNWGTEMPVVLRALIRPLQSLFATSWEECGETLTESFLNLPKGFSLMDQKGQTIENGILHSREERDVIVDKTLQLLPEIE